jgi:hypothetical protein
MNMNTTAHTLISSSIATGLALYTLLATAITGLGSTATITGISLFVAFGMIEIMIQSYAPPTGVLSGARRTPARPHAAAEVVAFPTVAAAERKAA